MALIKPFQLISVLILIVGIVSAQNDNSTVERQERNFNNFNNNFNNFNNNNNFNNFNNLFSNNRQNQALYSECTTQLGTSGICMRALECKRSSGVPSGFCSAVTVCCSNSLQCGGSSNAKRIVIDGNSPTTTSATPTSSTCQYRITPFNQNVCQLRIEFTTNLGLAVVPPGSMDGTMPVCTDSYLGINEYRFCGTNTNQHIYVPFAGLAANTQVISVVTGAATAGSWKITVTQVECPPSTANNNFVNNNNNNNPGQILNLQKLLKKNYYDTDLIAPNGCLQYFTNQTGTFESFNYNNGVGPYPPNMQYAICFRRPATATSLQLVGLRFQLSDNNDGTAVDRTDGDCFDETGLTPTASNDYLLVPISMIVQSSVAATRYCGDILENMNLLATPPGPFTVLFNSGNILQTITPGNPNPPRAFRITYNII